ncbi:DUF6011 domain-containing protein [Streptomyces sp. NPDC020794]|uniref:DUF6011 domain-containing protein n=1 Tax=unclassified Streptomyces TaxID=2593676 RepID=UPI0036F0E806
MKEHGSDDEPVICLGGCGRTLTSSTSRDRGYGKDCWRKLHGRPAPRLRRAAPRGAAPGPEQPELPLNDQLAIWSPA